MHAVIEQGPTLRKKRREQLAYAFRPPSAWLAVGALVIAGASFLAWRVAGSTWLLGLVIATGLPAFGALVAQPFSSIVTAEDGILLGGLFGSRYVAFRDLSIDDATWPRLVLRDREGGWVHLGSLGSPGDFDDLVHRLRAGMVGATNVGAGWFDASTLLVDEAATRELITLGSAGTSSLERVSAARELTRRGVVSAALRREAKERWADPEVLAALGLG